MLRVLVFRDRHIKQRILESPPVDSFVKEHLGYVYRNSPQHQETIFGDALVFNAVSDELMSAVIYNFIPFAKAIEQIPDIDYFLLNRVHYSIEIFSNLGDVVLTVNADNTYDCEMRTGFFASLVPQGLMQNFYEEYYDKIVNYYENNFHIKVNIDEL